MLFEEMMSPCEVYDSITEPDGAGGIHTAWKPSGVTFNCAITMNSTMESQIAQKQGVTSIYLLTAYNGAMPAYDKIIKRLEDGAFFRITSDWHDKQTPKAASFGFVQANAERWTM